MTDTHKGIMPSKTTIGAGFTGASGVTLVVIIANSLPETAVAMKQILIHSAPSLSIGLSILSAEIWIRIKRILKQKEVDKAVLGVKASLEKCLKNPETSIEHKNDMRKSLEHLEKTEIKAKLGAVKELINTNISNPPR